MKPAAGSIDVDSLPGLRALFYSTVTLLARLRG